MTAQKYILVMDDSCLDENILQYFAQFGFEILQVSRSSEYQYPANEPEALLINMSLIDKDFALIENLYQRYKTPIIILSDNYNEAMWVRLLEAGADDVMIKPIHPRELHARISAIARRVKRRTQLRCDTKEVFIFEEWRLYPTARQLFNQNNEQVLSAKEYDLLLAFVHQPQQLLEREFLSKITQSHGERVLGRRIDVQISRLRQKIERDKTHPTLIKTIRNKGYMLMAKVVFRREE